MRNVTGKPQLLGTITFSLPSYWLLMDLVWAVRNQKVPSVNNVSIESYKNNHYKLTYAVGS